MESAAAALVRQREVVPFADGLCVHAQQRFLAFADRWPAGEVDLGVKREGLPGPSERRGTNGDDVEGRL